MEKKYKNVDFQIIYKGFNIDFLINNKVVFNLNGPHHYDYFYGKKLNFNSRYNSNSLRNLGLNVIDYSISDSFLKKLNSKKNVSDILKYIGPLIDNSLNKSTEENYLR